MRPTMPDFCRKFYDKFGKQLPIIWTSVLRNTGGDHPRLKVEGILTIDRISFPREVPVYGRDRRFAIMISREEVTSSKIVRSVRHAPTLVVETLI